MGIAGVFAFLILLVATKNIIQSIISVLCVAVVIVSVLACMKFAGWQIGVAESLNTVMIIGFAVDYVIHLSADFMHSSHPTRFEKMRQGYREMGISIFSGAITTFGSGVFLFGGVLVFFQKFAVLICSCIGFSFLVAMMLFGATMHICGPENGFGDINKLNKLCKKKD